jgi:hypothetical protein
VPFELELIGYTLVLCFREKNKAPQENIGMLVIARVARELFAFFYFYNFNKGNVLNVSNSML